MSRLDLTDHQTYVASCVELADRRLGSYSSLDRIALDQDRLNRYDRLDQLQPPREILTLDQIELDRGRAVRMILGGGLLAEHTAAGEATRLGLGPKFLINPARDLNPTKIAELMSRDPGQEITASDLQNDLDLPPRELTPLSLGQRHLIQSAFDLAVLARERGQDFRQVLGQQRLLIVVSETSADEITAQVQYARFFGFEPRHVYLMVQRAYHGISRGKRGFYYDLDSPRRLHNHGQMAMQQTMDRQWFWFSGDNPEYLEAAEFEDILGGMSDKVSYNIENLDYLTGSIDLESLALALDLKDEGVNMVMEVVGNDPDQPQKGGLAAFDPGLDRDVMVESFQLEGFRNEDITFLNKNFNHYPDPVVAWRSLRDEQLPMPIVVKDGFLYYQPVQGDLNFQLPTRFFRRRELSPISAWKSGADTPAALNAMAAQDRQPHFAAFVREVTGLVK
ncbi:MAG: hypothetical protein KJ621_01750 [Proteobacteria bacterium]|nr:hypothetical protein [Pseudomonadota bacterium]MBU1740202.1 hypothetical protein [Pseudomonadota bacterium]